MFCPMLTVHRLLSSCVAPLYNFALCMTGSPLLACHSARGSWPAELQTHVPPHVVAEKLKRPTLYTEGSTEGVVSVQIFDILIAGNIYRLE